MNWMRKGLSALALLLMLCTVLCGCSYLDDLTGRLDGEQVEDVPDREEQQEKPDEPSEDLTAGGYASIEGIPDYAGQPYVVLNDNQPLFEASELVTTSYETYSELDSLGRCGMTIACVGCDLAPVEKRDDIGSVKPSGWVNNKYDTELVDGGYIYNRCHLIGFQLTGENANKQNLITGTRYLNIEGMLPFENLVADYIKETCTCGGRNGENYKDIDFKDVDHKEGTSNHVMYRVTPMYAGNNLVASGVRIEGYSVEDDGEEICFHVFAYNVQPGITINYATGENWLNADYVPPVEEETPSDQPSVETVYILNTNSKKIHLPTCRYAQDIKEENRAESNKSKEDLLKEGYSSCGTCKP